MSFSKKLKVNRSNLTEWNEHELTALVLLGETAEALEADTITKAQAKREGEGLTAQITERDPHIFLIVEGEARKVIPFSQIETEAKPLVKKNTPFTWQPVNFDTAEEYSAWLREVSEADKKQEGKVKPFNPNQE